MLRRLFPTLAVVAALAGTALAADPESGSVSAAAPEFKWTGSAFGPMGLPNAEGTGGTCDAPTCDTFSLDVADPGTSLTFTLTTTNYSNVEFEVELPDGKRVYQTSDDNEESRTTVIKNAPKGAYKVYAWAYALGAGPMEYQGVAKLATAGSTTPPPSNGEPPPPQEPSPPPSTQPPPPSTQPPPAGDAPATTMTVRARAGSARKLNRSRRLAVTVRPSAPVTNVAAQLLRGKKAVAIGKAARAEGATKVTLKLRKKLKRGRYTVFVSAKDAQGRPVKAKRSLRIKK